MLGVVPLVLISDYLSVTAPSYFSVVLGLVLLGIVFFVPDGLIGLLAPWRAPASRRPCAIPARAADRIVPVAAVRARSGSQRPRPCRPPARAPTVASHRPMSAAVLPCSRSRA